jgi:hypothetical protein
MREEPRPDPTGPGYCISSFYGNLTSRFAAIFCTRELSDGGAPTARSMLARGNAPGMCPSRCPALKGRRSPAPPQGAPIDSETQGVALGWSATALSAPKSEICKSQFAGLWVGNLGGDF